MVGEEKSNGEIYWVFGLFAVLITLNFLIVNSFADECSTANQTCVDGLNPWYVFFMRFQTFITGLLAIVAALITVHQMRKSDIRADNRHEGLMRIQLKSEAEGIDTLMKIYGVPLILARITADGYEKELKKIVIDPAELANSDFIGCLSNIRQSISDVEQIITGRHWDDFYSILDADARSAMHMLRECVETANLIFDKATYVNANGELVVKPTRFRDRISSDIYEVFEIIPHQLHLLQRAIGRRSSVMKSGSENE